MDVLQATFADPVRFLKYPMLMLGDLGQFVAGDLHPYRWPIPIGLLALPAAIIVLAYHGGWHVAACARPGSSADRSLWSTLGR